MNFVCEPLFVKTVKKILLTISHICSIQTEMDIISPKVLQNQA